MSFPWANQSSYVAQICHLVGSFGQEDGSISSSERISNFCLFLCSRFFFRFKIGFPPRKIKIGVSAVDEVALLPCREREFLYCQTQRLILYIKILVWWSLGLPRQSTVRKKKATGTFTYNALRTKILKERTKTQRKIVSHSNTTRAMLFVQERLPINHIFPYAQWAQFGSQGVVAKCTAAIFFSYDGFILP